MPIFKKRRKYDYGTTGTKNLASEKARMKKAGENKESASMLESVDWKPITRKTYQFETRRKKSTKGYKIEAQQHYKAFPTVK